jgi:hypothetical protein
MNAAEHWYVSCSHDLWALSRALHTLIVADPAEQPTPPRVIRRGDRFAETHVKGNDRDADYATIPDPTSKPTGGHSDPVLEAVTRRIDTVGATIGPLIELVGAIAAATQGAPVLDMSGGELAQPSPVRMVVTNTGRRVLQVPPSMFPALVKAHVFYADTALWSISERWSRLEGLPTVHGEAADVHIQDRAKVLQAMISQALKRHTHAATTTTVRCVNPHGLLNHPSGNGTPTCAACSAPKCADPLDMGCRNRLSVGDARRNAKGCAACRKRKSRTDHKDTP